MNIYRFECKSQRGAALGWAAVLGGLIYVLFLIFPLFQNPSVDLESLFGRFPKLARNMFGITNYKLNEVSGFYPFALKICMEFGLIGAFIMGNHAMNRELVQKTADFLYSRPVSRKRIFVQKVLAVYTSALLIWVIYAITAQFVANYSSNQAMEQGRFLLTSTVLLWIVLLFQTYGIALGACFPRFKGAAALGIGNLFLMELLLNLLEPLFGGRSMMTRIWIPVYYFDREAIMQYGRFELGYCLLWLAEIVILLLVSLRKYQRRDW